MTEPLKLIENAESELAPVFLRIEQVEFENTQRVLKALKDNRIGARHFAPTTGYGYDDIGRDALDRVFASALGTEDALVRAHIVSGTHAIFIALDGLLSYGDTMLSVTGRPYDTLSTAIGISRVQSKSSLIKRNGLKYEELDLTEDGSIDLRALEDRLKLRPRIAYFQRSRGYAYRNAFSIASLKEAFDVVKRVSPDSLIVVDNCYGEFTETLEPSMVGADVIIGSLIKNPGAGLAPTGGYIAATAQCISEIEGCLTVPGMGREVGSYAHGYREFYQGLFLAPHTVAQSLKSACLFAAVFEKLGCGTLPKADALRSDIVQSVRFNTREELIQFVQSVQAVSPVDGFVVPEPWDMPGYDDQVIMAAGTFVSGASIELSADAPMRKPYTAYIQGALSYAHGRLCALSALENLIKE